jgi:hypothetical protein
LLSSSSSRCSSIAVGVLPKLFDAFFLSPSSHPATAGEVHSPLTPPKRLHPASFVREDSDACAGETVAPPSFWRLEGDGWKSGSGGERGFAGGKEGREDGQQGAMRTVATTSSSQSPCTGRATKEQREENEREMRSRGLAPLVALPQLSTASKGSRAVTEELQILRQRSLEAPRSPVRPPSSSSPARMESHSYVSSASRAGGSMLIRLSHSEPTGLPIPYSARRVEASTRLPSSSEACLPPSARCAEYRRSTAPPSPCTSSTAAPFPLPFLLISDLTYQAPFCPR